MPSLRGAVRILKNRIRGGNDVPDQFHLIHAVKNELVGEVRANALMLEHGAAASQTLRDQQSITATRVEAILDELRATRDELGFAKNEIIEAVDHLAPKAGPALSYDIPLAEISEKTAALLNYARSHRSPLAEVGLWLNEPIVIEWLKGSARIGAVNERIIEQPFVFGALAGIERPGNIVDIGGAESSVGLALASLGHRVTVIEPAGYPFEHPNLTHFGRRLDEFVPSGPVDAVVMLSAIEHFGIGAYSGPGYEGVDDHDLDADARAVETIRSILAPGGLFVLTTPFGPWGIDGLERTYDAAHLKALLDGFDIEEVVVGSRLDHTTWVVDGDSLDTPAEPGHVAMVRARLGS